LADARVRTWLVWVVRLGLALALAVIVLGAYTRLVDAGLGCPDWPGCYGFLVVPDADHEIAAAEARFPHAPFEAHKAWPEMVHRYFASALGALVLVILGLCFAARRTGAPVRLAVALAALIALQGAFGAWTVTLQLWPQVVTAHLLGGFATFALLWWLRLALARPSGIPRRFGAHAALGLAFVIVQVALGGWTTSNYAALACPDFPTCQTEWWPEMDFAKGFDVFQEVGPNYLGGFLDSDARAAIHMTHRLGAVAVLLLVGSLASRMLRSVDGGARRLGAVVAVVLVTQLGLGIANVVLALPLAVATAHNAVGAMVLLVLVSVNYRAFSRAMDR